MQPEKLKTKTTIFLTDEQRKLVDKSGKTVQKFIDDVINMYRLHDMDRWGNGRFFHRQTRVFFIRTNLFDEILRDLSNPYDTGKKAGESARTTISVVWGFDMTKSSDRVNVFELSRKISGWGVISELQPDKLIIESPAILNEQFLRGYLEGLMSTQLRTIEATPDRIIFQFEERRSHQGSDNASPSLRQKGRKGKQGSEV